MSERVRVGMVGTSWWADLMHLPALTSHPDAEVVAVCGRNHERADAIADKFGIPERYTDCRQMIDKATLDAVVVSTPDDTHHSIALAALDAGLHIVCEKPLTSNAAQAKELADVATSRGLVNVTYFTNRWVPDCVYAKRLLDEGVVGRVFHCHIHTFAGYGRRGAGWRFDPAHGSGVLGDLGSHAIDLARWFVGEITRVSASITNPTVPAERPPEGLADPANTSAILTVEFANGAHGVIHTSAAAYVADRKQQRIMSFHGEDGTLEVSMTRAGAFLRSARAGEEAFRDLPIPLDLLEGTENSPKFVSPFDGVFTKRAVGDRAFIDSVIAGTRMEPDFHDGFRAQQVIDAAFESAETGRHIDIPLSARSL